MFWFKFPKGISWSEKEKPSGDSSGGIRKEINWEGMTSKQLNGHSAALQELDSLNSIKRK